MNASAIPASLVGFAFVVEVVDVRVVERSGQKKDKSGTYDLRLQECFLHTGHGYPDRFDLSLPKDASGKVAPYKPGFYALSPASVKVNNLRLDFGYEVELIPLPAAAGK